MNKYRVAIIGFGRSGQDIHGAFFASEANSAFEVVAVVDELEIRRQQAKEKFNCDVYGDYHEILGRKDIDLCVNATYSYLHAPIAVDLLSHGFHVVTEKPFAVHADDCRKMIDTAAEHGVMLGVFQQSHFAPYYQRIREIMASGVLGRIAEIKIRFGGFGRRWDWQCSQRFGGGCLRNTGPHPLEQALDILDLPDGELPTVASRLDLINSYGDAEDFAKVLLLAPGKPLIDLEITSCNAYSDYLYLIEGSFGTLKATMDRIDYKFYDPKAVAEPKLTLESLQGEDGRPLYCGETLPWQEVHEELAGTSFDTAVERYYTNIANHLSKGEALVIRPERIKTLVSVMEEIHRQNPLPVTV